MNIKGRFITLRAMTRSDMQLVCDIFNDPEIESLVVGWAFPLSIDQQESWFNAHIGDQCNHRFVVETEEDGPVGIATLVDIDWKNRRATHGVKLAHRESRSKGIGTDTVMAIMRYAFDELGLHRLDSSWFDFNIPSKQLYKKLGWREEGVVRDAVYKGGKWRNLIISGILENDYRETVLNTNYWGEAPSDSEQRSDNAKYWWECGAEQQVHDKESKEL